ncbi:MAG: ABC transporter permease, partial [Thermotogota bacterium]|nr:ABC transporter permease [Thermotogota bacterium]
MKLALSIAFRFISSSKAQTLLIILGIAIGVSVQVFIGSLIQGLQKDLVNTTIGNSSQVTITSNTSDRKIDNWQKILEEVESIQLPTPLTALSASADVPVFISSGDRTISVLLRGLQFPQANSIYGIDAKIIEGELPKTAGEVLVGKDLKDELGLQKGGQITIITPDRSIETLRIAGVFDLKVASLNKSWLISSISTSQGVGKLGDSVTSIEMQVEEVFKADEDATAIASALAD